MSRQTIIVIGAVALLVVIAGVSLYVLPQSNAPAMTDGPGMLYFYSPVCPICQGMKPIVDRLEETYRDLFTIVRVDIDRPAGKKLAREYGLVGQPSYIFFDSAGEEVRRMAGPQPFDRMAQEIERLLRE